ncbi:MAG: peptidylprolyl isomerase [Planctomycetota bacterium]
MSRSYVAGLLALAGATFSILASEMPGLEGVPAVVAEVNGKPIYREDLLRELVGSSGAEGLSRLVQRLLVQQAAAALKVTVSDEDIERQFVIDKRDLMDELIRTPWDKKQKEFPIEDILQARFRMTVAEYKQMVVRQRLLIRRCVANDLNPSDDDLLKFFNAWPALFQPPTRYHASHILITPFDPRDLYRGLAFRSRAGQMKTIMEERRRRFESHEERAQRLLTGRRRLIPENEIVAERLRRIELARSQGIQLDDAPNFDELSAEWNMSRKLAEKALNEINNHILSWDQAVRKYTKDPLDASRANQSRSLASERDRLGLVPGDVGWFHANGPLVREFYEGARNLKKGEISPTPVRTEYGYHLIKMLEIQEAPLVTFDQCRDKALRLYIENEIQERSLPWIENLITVAQRQDEQTLLWPPLKEESAQLGPAVAPTANANNNFDPLIGAVNGAPLRRSEVWRELIHTESDEALDRLINLEIVLSLLKDMGMERLEWECSDPIQRRKTPPPFKPVKITPDEIDHELNDDRLQLDRSNQVRKRQDRPEINFKQYLYEQYGQSEKKYRRIVEAGLILRTTIRQRVLTDDTTLQVEFAIARDAYGEPSWYEASHILIQPVGSMEKADKFAMQQALQIAEQIRKEAVANPENFPKLVETWSFDTPENKKMGGSLGAIYSDAHNSSLIEGPQLYREIKKQNLEKGQISAPLRSPRGFHILRVDKIHPERKVEFYEVKKRVERDYLQERAKMYTDLWLRALKSQAKVRNFLIKESAEDNHRLPLDRFPLPQPE